VSDVDYYDVQAMIQDARSEIRGEIDRAVHKTYERLRADTNAELQELRDEVRALERVLNSRTEHLA
jgi:Skp family chaperone for outer membrane proteins